MIYGVAKLICRLHIFAFINAAYVIYTEHIGTYKRYNEHCQQIIRYIDRFLGV